MMGHTGTRVIQEIKDRLDPMAAVVERVDADPRAASERTASLAFLGRMANRVRAELRRQTVCVDSQAPRDPLVKLVAPATMANLETWAHLVRKEMRACPGTPGRRVYREKLARACAASPRRWVRSFVVAQWTVVRSRPTLATIITPKST